MVCSGLNTLSSSKTPRTDRPIAPLTLTPAERATPEGWARRRKTSQALALRARIVLRCAEGCSNQAVAAKLGVSQPMVGK